MREKKNTKQVNNKVSIECKKTHKKKIEKFLSLKSEKQNKYTVIKYSQLYFGLNFFFLFLLLLLFHGTAHWCKMRSCIFETDHICTLFFSFFFIFRSICVKCVRQIKDKPSNGGLNELIKHRSGKGKSQKKKN